MRSVLGVLCLVALAGCSAATAPTDPLPPAAPSMDAGGTTSSADPGGCGPKDELNNGELKHCAPGQAPGNSNSPP